MSKNIAFIHKKIFSYLRKKKPKDLDAFCREFNDNIFLEINCLDCANCCKSISPLLLNKDIDILSKYLNLSRDSFEKKYVTKDTEGDYIFNKIPCPFLLDNNSCLVYTNRPKACREYPHINRKNIYQIENITIENSKICPAVNSFLDTLKDNYLPN